MKNINLTYKSLFNFPIITFSINTLIIIILFSLIILNYGHDKFSSFSICLTIALILSHVTTFSQNNFYFKNLKKKLDLTSILISFIIFIFVLLIFFYYEIEIYNIFSDINLFQLKFFIISLFFFSINKIILAFINNSLSANYFYFFSLLRYMALIIFFLILMKIKKNFFLCFLLSEIFLSLLLIIFLNFKNQISINFKGLKKRISFGIFSFHINLISESIFKIDLLMLAMLTNYNLVSIYSFFSLVFEGYVSFFYHLRIKIVKELAILSHSNKVDFKNVFDLVKSFSSSYLPIILLILPINIIFVLYLKIFLITNLNILDLIVFFIGVVFFSFSYPIFFIDNVLLYKNTFHLNIIFIFSLIFCVLSNLILINNFELFGAIISTIMTYLFILILNIFFLRYD